jgi:hypothetical protein
MEAAKVIETLLGLGVTVKRAYGLLKAHHGATDWVKFIQSKEFKAIQKDVQALLKSLKAKDIDQALKAVRAKEAQFLRGRRIAQLSAHELTQFNDLADVEVLLVDKKLRQLKASAAFFEHLVNDVLPVLLRSAAEVTKMLL